MSSSTTDTQIRALTCAVRSAEKLSRDCTSGMLRATSTVAQKEAAATRLADVLRAVLLVADVQGISLERCVQQRLREMMLEYPLPENLLQHPEPHVDAFGSSDHTTSTDNAASQYGLPTPLPLVDAAGAARRTHNDVFAPPVEGRPPMVRSSSSNSKLVGSATTKGPDEFPTPSASAASETGGGAYSPNSRLRLSSNAPTIGGCVQPTAAIANGPQSSMSSMHVFPSSSGDGPTMPRQNKDVLPAICAGTPPAAAASIGQMTHHMSHPAVAEYIDSVLYADESAGFADISAVSCKQQCTPEKLDSPQSLLDAVDPVHAEYLCSLMVNPSFVGTVSPMTPADIQRQSLCDMIPSASWTSMKRSYHEGLSRSQQLRRGGECSTGPSTTLVADSSTTALLHGHVGSPAENHPSHRVATVLQVEQPPVIAFGFADSKSHSALSTQTNTRQTTPQAAAGEMQVHNSSSLTRSFSSGAHEGGPLAFDVKAVLSDGSDPVDDGNSPTAVGHTQVLFPSRPRVSPKAAGSSREPPIGRIIRRKLHTVPIVGVHAVETSQAHPALPALESPSRPVTGPRLYFGLELLRQARDAQQFH